MELEREITCCFTGHRPDKLPLGGLGKGPRLPGPEAAAEPGCGKCLRRRLPPLHLRHGRGADFYFAEAVLALRQLHSDTVLEAARPCETQANSWPEADRRRYQAILDQCDLETLVQHHYDRGCMMRRNRYMVDRSSRIIAVYDGVPKGGTAQTLAYAMRQGLKTEILSLCQEEST